MANKQPTKVASKLATTTPVKATPVKDTKLKETKAQLFNRLGKLRVEKVLKSLRILGNCANRNNYEYTQAQVNKITLGLEKALTATINKFQTSKEAQESFEF